MGQSRAKDDRLRGPREEVPSARDLLEQAHALAAQVEGLLTEVSHEVSDSDTFRVRLARAHTLSLLDQLAELLGARSSGRGPSVRGTHASHVDDDENAGSGVRQAPAWR
jgi:hypothetical protein